ncbi:MAG: hypothetical protein AAGA92_05200 [Planctomycetota bacterium]
MHPHAGKLWWFLAFGSALAAFCGRAGHATPARPGDSVVLLHNSNVLVGRVSLENDRYVVSQPHGLLRMPRHKVRMICGSLEEAYAQLRRELQTDDSAADPAELCELIAWGLRHGITEQCMADLTRLDPRNLRVAALMRRLNAAQVQPAMASRSAVRHARKMQPTALEEPAKAELEDPLQDARWLRRVPRDIRGEFVSRVQPILARGCGAAGCHAPTAGRTFQIDRLAIDGAGHAAVTTANLRRLFEMLTADAEATERMVDHAGRPHGLAGARLSQPLNPKQQAIVRDWFAGVEKEVLARVAASSVEPGPASVVPGRVEFQGPSYSGSDSASTEKHAASAQRLSAPAKKPRLEDPFDPDRFNQRHHPER